MSNDSAGGALPSGENPEAVVAFTPNIEEKVDKCAGCGKVACTFLSSSAFTFGVSCSGVDPSPPDLALAFFAFFAAFALIFSSRSTWYEITSTIVSSHVLASAPEEAAKRISGFPFPGNRLKIDGNLDGSTEAAVVDDSRSICMIGDSPALSLV